MSLKLKKHETEILHGYTNTGKKIKKMIQNKQKDIGCGQLVTHLLDVSCVSALTDSDTPTVEVCGPLKDVCGKL